MVSPINLIEVPDLDDPKEQEMILLNNLKAQKSSKYITFLMKDFELLKGKQFEWIKCERTQLSA